MGYGHVRRKVCACVCPPVRLLLSCLKFLFLDNESRVLLETLELDHDNDYVNASYIPVSLHWFCGFMLYEFPQTDPVVIERRQIVLFLIWAAYMLWHMTYIEQTSFEPWKLRPLSLAFSIQYRNRAMTGNRGPTSRPKVGIYQRAPPRDIFTDHTRTTCGRHTDHISTNYDDDSISTAYQPHTDRLPTAYQTFTSVRRCDEDLAITHEPHTGHIPINNKKITTIYRPHTNKQIDKKKFHNIQATYQ